MLRTIAFSLLALAACASSASGPADAAIQAWVQTHYGEGLRSEQTFFGDFTGDGVADALVWVMYNDGGVHNFGEASLFRHRGGQFIYWRTDDTASGEAPHDVVIAPGQIRLTTTVLQDGDARCCPTGEQRWVIRAR